MIEIIIRVLLFLLRLVPLVTIFGFIGFFMFNQSKQRVDVSIGGTIFSWFIYVVSLIGTVFLIFIDNTTLKVIGFIMFASSIVLVVIVFAIDNYIKKSKLKSTTTKNVKAKLIGAIEKQYVSSTSTAREPVSKNYYSLVFEYEENNNKKICTTTKLYTLSEIAYINSLNQEINIKVYKKTCTLEIDTSLAPTTYNLEHLNNLKITNLEVSKLNQHYIRIFFTLGITIPMFIITIWASIVLWNSSKVSSLILFLIGIVLTITLILLLLPSSIKSILTYNKGTKTTALEFTEIGKTYKTHTYCIIKYTYKTENQIKTKKERVTINDYGKIKLLTKLPIKIYKNWAIIDLDKLK